MAMLPINAGDGKKGLLEARAEDVEPPVKGLMMDAARALQFVRSKAST